MYDRVVDVPRLVCNYRAGDELPDQLLDDARSALTAQPPANQRNCSCARVVASSASAHVTVSSTDAAPGGFGKLAPGVIKFPVGGYGKLPGGGLKFPVGGYKPYPGSYKPAGYGGWGPAGIGLGVGLAAGMVGAAAASAIADDGCTVIRRRIIDEDGNMFVRRIRVCE